MRVSSAFQYVIGDPELNSLIYKSRCTDLANWDLVESILASSTRNNAANGITGVMVFTKTHFLQILEGPFVPLNATFERIARDTRHEEIQLINFTEINEREFANWSMHGIGLFDINEELKSKLHSQFGSSTKSIRLPTKASEVKELLDILLS